MAWLSALGLYRWSPETFDGFQVPDGLDRDNVLQTILLETAELEFLYPEPETAAAAIELWTKAELPIWTELQKTKEYEYNPIYNVEAKETEIETRDLAGGRQGTGAGVNKVSAYNEPSWTDSGRQESEYEDSYNDGGTVTRERIRGGNIGVTMTQQLIQAQRDVVKFNLVEYILQSFKQRFCLLVY